MLNSISETSKLYSQFYIGTGEKTKMYTLRHQFEEIVNYAGVGVCSNVVVMRDYYIRNLSIDSEKAVQSAKDQGYEVSAPKFSLQEIYRMDSVETEEKRVEAEERFKVTQKEKQDAEIELVKEHKFPFGRNAGMGLKELISKKGDGFAGYFMIQGRQEEASATIVLLGRVLEMLYPIIAENTFRDISGNGTYFGKVGIRQKLVNVKHVASYGYDGFYGYCFIEKFLTEGGQLLTYMGASDLDVEIGKDYVISFGIKEHELYKNEYQTKILRVKINS